MIDVVIKGLLFAPPHRNMQGQFWRSVDENWGGSLTFKVICVIPMIIYVAEI